MSKYRDLTPDELAAVVEYAKEKGRRWKESLRDDWFHARVPGLIQSIRNSHGPSWLVKFKLPKGI